MGSFGGGEKGAYRRAIQGESWQNCSAVQDSAKGTNKPPLL